MSGLIALLAFACSEGGMEQQTSGDSVTEVPWTQDSGGDDTGTDSTGNPDSTAGVDTDSGDSGNDTADSGTGSGSGSGSGTGVPPVDDDADGWSADVDCDDHDAAVHPSAVETCNGIDDDCNVAIDDGLAAYTSYEDGDRDGFGIGPGRVDCVVPSGFVTNADDCDDGDSSVSPLGTESCNGIDDDCDASIDDGLPSYTSYTDADGDGYGSGAGHVDCRVPSGLVMTSGDCDDSHANVHPGGFEICNDGLDSDCDGSPSALCTLTGEYDLVDGDWSVVGNDTSNGFGNWADIGGDLDGDGSEDILALAPGAQTTVGSTTYVDGAAYVFFGPTGGPVANASDASVTYVAAGANALQYGAALASDVDGDGYGDLLVGAPGYDSYNGVVDLAFGPFASGDLLASTSAAIEKLASSESGARVGTNVDDAGDVNGDGDTDFLLGASRADDGTVIDAGAKYLVLGPITGSLNLPTDSHATLYGDNRSAGCDSHSVGGDLNGDGYSDVAVGLPDDTYGSAVYPGGVSLFTGPFAGDMTMASADVRIEGLSSYGYLGYDLAIVEDQDGDGYAELLATEMRANNGVLIDAGAVYLWNGDFTPGTTIDSSDAVATWNGVEEYQNAGTSIATGDVDGDGAPDVIIGAGGDTKSSSTEGTVYVDYGPVGGTSDVDALDAVFHGQDVDGMAGFSLGAGDVNGDGYDDFFAGAPGYDDAVRSDAGRGYLWYGLGF